jgi:hypothetical protein
MTFPIIPINKIAKHDPNRAKILKDSALTAQVLDGKGLIDKKKP